MPFTDKQNLSVLENIFVEEGVQFLEWTRESTEHSEHENKNLLLENINLVKPGLSDSDSKIMKMFLLESQQDSLT